MRKELQLAQIYHGRELEDDFLRVSAELRTQPAFAVHAGVQQLGDRVLGILARAVNDLVFKLDLALLKRVVAVELLARHLFKLIQTL